MLEISRIAELILSGASGAFAGYITNKYAVNMLFKEYTPFKIGSKVVLPYKFGGVIKNRKDKFIEELSELVERDIINTKTIKPKLSDFKFKKNIESLSNNFINISLKQIFENTSLNSLNGYEITKNNIFNYIDKNADIFLLSITKSIANKIDDGKINKNIFINISKNIISYLIEELSNNYDLRSFADNLYDEKSDFKLKELLSSELISEITNNINIIIENSISDFFEDEDKVRSSISKILNTVEVRDLLANYQKGLYNTKISKFISESECKNISISIFNLMLEALNDDKDNVYISNILSGLINTCKEIDLTLDEIIDDQFEASITEYLNSILKDILPYFSEFIRNNKDDFDSIIEKSINTGIANMDESIRKFIITKVRELFLDNVSAKNEIVEKLTMYIDNYSMDYDAEESVKHIIKDFLSQVKVKDIAYYIERSSYINTDTIDDIKKVIIKVFNERGQSFINDLINNICNNNIGNYINTDLSEILNKLFIKAILTNRNNLKDKLINLFKNRVMSESQMITNTPINQLLSKNDYKLYSAEFIETGKASIKTNKDKLVRHITKMFEERINDLNVTVLLTDHSDLYLNNMKEITMSYIARSFEKYESISIAEIINKININNELSESLKDTLLNSIKDDMDGLLKGNVKKIVYNNLINYDEDEICNLAVKFMGNELKPLSIFGGGLGLISGLVFGLFGPGLYLNGFYTSIMQQVFSVILMALIGAGTNVIAIYMLFKPFKKNRFISKIPFLKKFALGYIPAHKESLGRGIGKTLKDDLLNDKKVKTLLYNNKDLGKCYIMNYIENSNYKHVIDFLNSKKRFILNYLYEKLNKNLSHNKNQISINIAQHIGEININSLLNNKIKTVITSKIIKSKERINGYILSIIENNDINNSRVLDCLPNDLRDKIDYSLREAMINYMNDKLRNIDFTNIKSELIKYNKYYDDIMNKDVDEVININDINDYLMNNYKGIIFKSISSLVIMNTKNYIIKELSSKKTLGDIFNGKFKLICNKNIYNIKLGIINKINELVINKEEYISDIVKSEINAGLNFFEKMGYAMAGGDDIVDNCIDVLVRRGIPEFLDDKSNDIDLIVNDILNDIIYEIKADQLNLDGTILKTDNLQSSLCIKLNENKLFYDSVYNSIKKVLCMGKKKKISYYAYSFNCETLEKLMFKFNTELNQLINDISNVSIKEKNELNNILVDLIDEHITSTLKSIKICNIIDLSSDNINSLTDIIFNSTAFNNEICNLINYYKEKLDHDSNLAQFIDQNELNEFIYNLVNLLLTDKSINDSIKQQLELIFNDLTEKNLSIIDNSLKDNLNDKISEAIVNSFVDKIDSLLISLELDKTAFVQIKNMDSKEIYDLFYSFAGDFFNKLYSYGLIGGIFGVNAYLSIIIAILENFKKNDILE